LRCHAQRLSHGQALGYSSLQKMCPDISSPAEQRQLRTLLDTFLSSIDAPMTENEFAYKLVEIGVVAPQLTVVTRTIA